MRNYSCYIADRDLREFIALGALYDAIEGENIAKSLRLKDKNILISGFFDVKDLYDLEG